MKGRLFTRVFDHHTFACYFAAIALMLFLVGGHRSPLLFFMGFSAQDRRWWAGYYENDGMESLCSSARLCKHSFSDA